MKSGSGSRRLPGYTAGVLWLSIVVEAAPAVAAAFLAVHILHSGFSRGYSDWVSFLLAIVVGFRNVRAIVRDVRQSRAQRLSHRLETGVSPGI